MLVVSGRVGFIEKLLEGRLLKVCNMKNCSSKVSSYIFLLRLYGLDFQQKEQSITYAPFAVWLCLALSYHLQMRH